MYATVPLISAGVISESAALTTSSQLAVGTAPEGLTIALGAIGTVAGAGLAADFGAAVAGFLLTANVAAAIRRIEMIFLRTAKSSSVQVSASWRSYTD